MKNLFFALFLALVPMLSQAEMSFSHQLKSVDLEDSNPQDVARIAVTEDKITYYISLDNTPSAKLLFENLVLPYSNSVTDEPIVLTKDFMSSTNSFSISCMHALRGFFVGDYNCTIAFTLEKSTPNDDIKSVENDGDRLKLIFGKKLSTALNNMMSANAFTYSLGGLIFNTGDQRFEMMCDSPSGMSDVMPSCTLSLKLN